MAESYISELGDSLSHGVDNTNGDRVKIIAPKLYNDGNGNHPSIATALSGKAASSHTHGNIANGGTLQTNDITIANGDKLVVTDSSDSSKVARASIAFDGSTTTQALTKAGTWATFNNYSHPAGSAPSKTGVPTANATPGFGGTFKVNQITTDATSHVSAVTERTITIPNATATTSADGLMSAADKTKLDGIAAGTASPLMDGKASVGNSLKYAREDHVHPSDTSREDIANKTTVVLGTSDSKYPTDKAVAEFVNSSIATNTANYISNNGEPFTSVEQLEAYSGPVTNNDYAFVAGIDSEGNTYYDRYKATVIGSTVTWALEYRLNNSSFTAAQWSAINSGITSALVAKIHEHSNKDVLDGITSSDVANWNSKMDKQTVGNASEPVYIENGIAKVATNVATNGKLNVDGSNATTAGVTTMMKKVDSGTDKLNDDNTYFGDSNADHAHIVRRPILNLWDYIKNKVQTQLLGSVGSADKPIYLVNGVPKVCNDKLNVDGSNATTVGVTSMMRRVESGSEDLNDDSYYFGDSNADHKHIVRRPILNIWNYIKNKVQTQLLGSVGSVDKPIYLENGVPKVCADGVPYSKVSYGGSVGYGVFVGGSHNVANSTRIYCTFFVTAALHNDKIAHTYIGTFTFRGGILNCELKCLTGIPAYPLRITTVYTEDGKDSNGNPTYTLGLFVIPPDKTTKYSNYKLTRIASSSDFIWDVKNISEVTYDECNSVAKPALKPIILTWDAIASNVSTTGGTWIPSFDKATIIDCRGIVDMSIQVDLSIIGQRTYIDDFTSYEITLVNSSKTDILPASLHQTGRMPRQAYSSSGTIDGTIDISHTHRFIFPITSTTNLLAGYMPKITLPSRYTLDSGAQVSIKALCRGIVLPYGADEYF